MKMELLLAPAALVMASFGSPSAPHTDSFAAMDSHPVVVEPASAPTTSDIAKVAHCASFWSPEVASHMAISVRLASEDSSELSELNAMLQSNTTIAEAWRITSDDCGEPAELPPSGEYTALRYDVARKVLSDRNWQQYALVQFEEYPDVWIVLRLDIVLPEVPPREYPGSLRNA